MRRAVALLLGLGLTGTLLGCVTGPPAPGGWLDRLQVLQSPSGPDVVQIDLAVLEMPLADGYLFHDVWQEADDQVVGLERQAALEDNGFQVGQVGGITPAGLLSRLTSDRSCSTGERRILHAGHPTSITIGPSVSSRSFAVLQDGKAGPGRLDHAACVLEVLPTLAADGRTSLRFTPVLESTDRSNFYKPTPDRSGWMVGEEKETRSLSNLSWEVTLAVNEYVIVGGRHEREGTLGYQFFIRPEESPPRQRLLVIRTGRAVPSVAGEVAPSGAEEPNSSKRCLPLALQASLLPGCDAKQ
jgi:hypothetical protein